MRLFVLSILAFGAIWAPEAGADEGSPVGEARQTYEVRPRDRFETLAVRFGVTPEEIRAANPGAYGIRCLRPFSREGRDGERRDYCGRPRYYLIAGKTLTIPTPRLLVESENVRLGAENTALEAERNEAQRERDSLKQERDALCAERDRIAAEKEELLRAKQELQGRYDELKRTPFERPANNASFAAQDKSPTSQTMYNREAFLFVILAIIGCSLLVIAHRHFTRPGLKLKRVAEELGRERADLEATRKILVKEGQDLAECRRQLDADDLETRTQRSTLERDQESLRTQRDELGRWEESLKAREVAPASEKSRIPTTIGVPPIFPPVPTGKEKAGIQAGLLQAMVARGRQMLEEESLTLAGREAACTVREKAIERRAAALNSLQDVLTERERLLAEKEHGVEELRRSLSGGKAACAEAAVDQEQREADLVLGFADLESRRKELEEENRARQTELDRRASEIDAKVRMYDEDILPAIKRGKEDLAARAAELDEQKKSSDRRQAELDDAERGYERRLKELNDTVGALDERAEKLGEGERKLSEEHLQLQNDRDAFNIEREEAKSLLARAKRKKEIAEALDRRESAVADKERELAGLSQRLDDRAADLNTWEERLKDKARGLGVADEDDDETRQVLPPPSSSDGSITHLDFAEPGSGPSSGGGTGSGSGLAIGVELYTCAACGQTMDVAEVEVHKAVCPKTARHVKTISPPATALLPESFYCSICLAIVASTEEEYLAHLKKHKEEAASKPEASGEDRAEAPSRFVCPQCGKSVDWEEIETHECSSDSEAK